MKNLSSLLTLVVVASACGVENPGAPAPSLPTYTLVGTVLEAKDTGREPVPGVLIRDDSESTSTTTDGQGRYSLQGLRAPERVISYSKPGTSAIADS